MGLVAFLSDLGLGDYYVGAVKAVIKRMCPFCEVIDITHEVKPWSLLDAEYMLTCCYDDFPEETVFLVVVDPGVGTSRRAIVVRAGGYWFVGPDNGVMAGIIEREGSYRAWAIERVPLVHKSSHTFHGRDVFAPVAAHLARGGSVEEVGVPVADLARLEKPPTGINGNAVRGYVAHIDRFGNVATSITVDMLRRVGASMGSNLLARVRGREFGVTLFRAFGEAREGELFALVNSCGRLEFAVNKGRASDATGLELGESLEVEVV